MLLVDIQRGANALSLSRPMSGSHMRDDRVTEAGVTRPSCPPWWPCHFSKRLELTYFLRSVVSHCIPLTGPLCGPSTASRNSRVCIAYCTYTKIPMQTRDHRVFDLRFYLLSESRDPNEDQGTSHLLTLQPLSQ